jgi:hypothetical protein
MAKNSLGVKPNKELMIKKCQWCDKPARFQVRTVKPVPSKEYPLGRHKSWYECEEHNNKNMGLP